MDHRDVLSAARNRVIDAELRYKRAQRKIDAALAYLEQLHGSLADPHVLRDLLTTNHRD